MKIVIAILFTKLVLTFETPGPGTYYVFRSYAGRSQVVAAGWEPCGSHVAVTVPGDADISLYWTQFWPGNTFGN